LAARDLVSLISVFVALVKRDCVAVARPRSQQEDGNTAVVGGLENDTYIGAAWVFTRGTANDGDRERRPCPAVPQPHDVRAPQQYR
jgi:hypothetical protein